LLVTAFAVAEDRKASALTHVKAAEAAKLVEGQKVTVLDVRTPEEFREGHIKGAKNVDFNAPDFAARLRELDKTKPYLLHCKSGGRSSNSLATFKELGFEKIFHLDGGIMGWEAAKLPVEK
jgi:rhodanese-related sulfurtransferase